jgi:hypothetical protein
MKAQFGSFGRKLSALCLVGAAAVISLASSAQANTATIKPVPCSVVDLTGRYSYGRPHTNVIELKQNGCQLTVTDKMKRAVWTFDLSGQTETSVPAAILDANKDSEFARRSLESMRITAQLVYRDFGNEPGFQFPVIQLKVRENLPKVPDTYLHKGNTIDVDIEFSGFLYIAADGIPQPNGGYKLGDIRGLGLDYQSKVRVVRINDLAYSGVIEQAFMAGANYILKWADDVMFRSLDFMNLRRIP